MKKLTKRQLRFKEEIEHQQITMKIEPLKEGQKGIRITPIFSKVDNVNESGFKISCICCCALIRKDSK